MHIYVIFIHVGFLLHNLLTIFGPWYAIGNKHLSKVTNRQKIFCVAIHMDQVLGYEHVSVWCPLIDWG